MGFMSVLSLRTLIQSLYMIRTKCPKLMHNGQDVSVCLHVSGRKLHISLKEFDIVVVHGVRQANLILVHINLL
jgi:hypothetical protein